MQSKETHTATTYHDPSNPNPAVEWRWGKKSTNRFSTETTHKPFRHRTQPRSAIMGLGVWDGERLRDRVEEKWDSREIGAENEEINRRCRRCAGAWVGGKWRNWSLQREEMKSARTDWGEREATGRNEKPNFLVITPLLSALILWLVVHYLYDLIKN